MRFTLKKIVSHFHVARFCVAELLLKLCRSFLCRRKCVASKIVSQREIGSPLLHNISFYGTNFNINSRNSLFSSCQSISSLEIAEKFAIVFGLFHWFKLLNRYMLIVHMFIHWSCLSELMPLCLLSFECCIVHYDLK